MPQHPLYKYLKTEAGGLLGDDIKWNFTKFLVSREGKVLDRYASLTRPEQAGRRHCQSAEGVGCRRPVRTPLSRLRSATSIAAELPFRAIL